MCNKRCKYLLIVILCAFQVHLVYAQSFSDRFGFRGYVKNLNILNLVPDTNWNTQSIQQNLIHNRLNFRLDLQEQLQLGLEVRNRVFYGEFLKYYPPNMTYGDILNPDPGIVDMNWTWADNSNVVGHTAIDRLWLNWSNDDWDVRLGRQRINWGQNLVWNPNDIFNVLNFTDFDYEERPATDAVRVQRYFNNGSSLEAIYELDDEWEETVAAGLYRFNAKGYDVQLIAGKYVDDMAFALGWAGNIKDAGFKGEVTHFEPMNDSSSRATLASLSYDYSFKKGTYILTSFLYNTFGTNDLDQLLLLSNTQGGNLDVKRLMPNKFTFFIQAMHQFHPLMSTNISAMYAVDLGGVFLMPMVSYSVRDDFDLSLVGQGFLGKSDDKIRNLGSGIFFRLKWSYAN